MLGTTPPCSIQGDFSLIDRKSEENGVAEAASKYNENVGFMSYNALAGGMLTGKYMSIPSSMDDLTNNRERAIQNMERFSIIHHHCHLDRHRLNALRPRYPLDVELNDDHLFYWNELRSFSPS